MAEEQTESNEETRQPAGDTAAADDHGREAARSYSQEDVDRIVKERLARERAKHADYDDVKRKAGEADSLREELDKAKTNPIRCARLLRTCSPSSTGTTRPQPSRPYNHFSVHSHPHGWLFLCPQRAQ